MVSRDMQRALTGQWTRQYAETQGQSVPRTPIAGRANDVAAMAAREIRGMGRKVPDANWVGFDQRVDWEDTKTVMVRHEGMDTHDFNIWDDRTNSLLRKPYLHGAAENLTSRRMPVEITGMSRDMDRNLAASHFPVEAISHNNNVSFAMNNNVNYGNWMKDQYDRQRDSIFGR